MVCNPPNNENLESLMRSEIYCHSAFFSEYLVQCNKTRKEVIHNKKETNHDFFSGKIFYLVKSTRSKKTVEHLKYIFIIKELSEGTWWKISIKKNISSRTNPQILLWNLDSRILNSTIETSSFLPASLFYSTDIHPATAMCQPPCESLVKEYDRRETPALLDLLL